MGYTVKFKRLHDEPETDDGARVLVDPSLPQGLGDENHGLDEWYAKVAPSSGLRKALRKKEIAFPEFARAYQSELEQNPALLTPLLKYAREQGLTLLGSTQQLEESYLPILQQAVLRALAEEDAQATDGEPSSPTCYDR